MKFLTRFGLVLAASLSLLAGSAQAEVLKNPGTPTLEQSQAASNDQIKITDEAEHVETSFMSEASHLGADRYQIKHQNLKSRQKYKKRKRRSKRKSKKKGNTIAQIRASAIKSSLSGIKELKPYASNYRRMKSAVRSYWRRHTTNATAKGLNATIMRYVKRKHRKLVRSEVYSGSKSGVRKVKRQLAKRKK